MLALGLIDISNILRGGGGGEEEGGDETTESDEQIDQKNDQFLNQEPENDRQSWPSSGTWEIYWLCFGHEANGEGFEHLNLITSEDFSEFLTILGPAKPKIIGDSL